VCLSGAPSPGAVAPVDVKAGRRALESGGSRTDERITVASAAASDSAPAGYRLRRPSAEDAPAAADLKRAVEVARHGDSDVTPAQIVGEWLAFRFQRPDLDLDLWWVAWDGAEVAGSLLAFESPLGGYIDSLFVRRPWRGRGLGRALLREAFAELRRRGFPRACLGVDSENPTGAMGLYGSVGMRPKRGAHLVFEKDLPSG